MSDTNGGLGMIPDDILRGKPSTNRSREMNNKRCNYRSYGRTIRLCSYIVDGVKQKIDWYKRMSYMTPRRKCSEFSQRAKMNYRKTSGYCRYHSSIRYLYSRNYVHYVPMK
jgi:hypothetical protein